jgi:hypothetical protein
MGERFKELVMKVINDVTWFIVLLVLILLYFYRYIC